MATGIIHQRKGTNTVCGAVKPGSKLGGHIFVTENTEEVTCKKCLNSKNTKVTPEASPAEKKYSYKEAASKSQKKVEFDYHLTITSKAALEFAAFDFISKES